MTETFAETALANADDFIVANAAGLPPALRLRVEVLSKLPQNWDGEGALAVRRHALADVIGALKIISESAGSLREPFIAPLFNGFLQMEWHDPKRSLEIEAKPGGWYLVGTVLPVDGKRVYFTSECERGNLQKLVPFYQWFVNAELLWPLL